MTDQEFIEQAKKLICKQVPGISIRDFKMIWFCSLGGNYRALFKIYAKGSYYEATYILEDDQINFDGYMKIGRLQFKDVAKLILEEE